MSFGNSQSRGSRQQTYYPPPPPCEEEDWDACDTSTNTKPFNNSQQPINDEYDAWEDTSKGKIGQQGGLVFTNSHKSSDRQGSGFNRTDTDNGRNQQSSGFGKANQQDEYNGRSQSNQNNGRGFDRAKQDQSESTSGEFRVAQKSIGVVIGKGGSKIRELQDQSGARIDIRKNDVENGMILIVLSGSEDQKQTAKKMIEETIDEGVNRYAWKNDRDRAGTSDSRSTANGFGAKNSGFGNKENTGFDRGFRNSENSGFNSKENTGFGGGFGNSETDEQREFKKSSFQSSGFGERGNGNSSHQSNSAESTTLEIHSRMVGRIIGKGGCKIKELQDTTGARINVSREEDGNDMKIVTLTGSEDSVNKAKEMITELISTDYDQPWGRFSSAASRKDNQTTDISPTFRGFGNSENSGFNSKENTGFGRGFGNSENSGFNSKENTGFGGGFGNSETNEQKEFKKPSFQNSGFGERGNGNSSHQSNSAESTTLEIHSNMVGRIIGKGGCKIKELQDTTGARINVSREEDENDMKIVTLTGSEDSVNKAKEMITELISTDYDQPRGGFGSATSKKDNQTTDTTTNSGGFGGFGGIDWDKIKEESAAYQKVKWQDYPEIRKNFYIENEAVANLDPDEVEEIRMSNNKIMVKNLGNDPSVRIPNPIQTFHEAFGHHPDIIAEIDRGRFHETISYPDASLACNPAGSGSDRDRTNGDWENISIPAAGIHTYRRTADSSRPKRRTKRSHSDTDERTCSTD